MRLICVSFRKCKSFADITGVLRGTILIQVIVQEDNKKNSHLKVVFVCGIFYISPAIHPFKYNSHATVVRSYPI